MENNRIESGEGVRIRLNAEEVATAIEAYLVAHGVHIEGARTIRVNKELIKCGSVYVDPSGYVIFNGVKYE